MDWTNFTPISSFFGGVLIGLSAFLLLFLNGRIAGISGILEKATFSWQGQSDRYWSLWFLGGLGIGGLVLVVFSPEVFGKGHPYPLEWVLVGGLLVGFGTRLGSGCTSGHGVCGLGRLSFRSLIAVLVFMGFGILTTGILQVFL
jgi:uncharacterized membrane protein YedE/YeeE